MKTLVIISSIFSLASCAPRLGEIQQSVLDEKTFRSVNGESWIAMEGQDIKNTDLGKLNGGMKKLPDARGQFFRTMNAKGAGIDPDSRTVGSMQEDAINRNIKITFNAKNSEADDGTGYQGWSFDSNSSDRRQLFSLGCENCSSETRPKNIAVYTYVKVNKKKNNAKGIE